MLRSPRQPGAAVATFFRLLAGAGEGCDCCAATVVGYVELAVACARLGGIE